MPDENATLRDTVVTDKTVSAADTKVENKTEDTTSAALALEDVDALELGRILRDSGVTKERVNDLLQAPGALNSLRHMVVNNPQEFLNMLERTDPDAARNFHEKMADIYVDRYQDKTPAGEKKDQATAGLMAQISALTEKTNQLLSKQERQEQAAMVAQVKSRYDGRVEDLLNQEGIKALNLTKSETKAFRASLDQQLGADPSVVQRINAGNFVDVPRAFKSIVEEWANDRKAAAEGERSAREKSEKNASLSFSLGADAGMVDLPAGFDESWDATETALAKALQGSVFKK